MYNKLEISVKKMVYSTSYTISIKFIIEILEAVRPNERGFVETAKMGRSRKIQKCGPGSSTLQHDANAWTETSGE